MTILVPTDAIYRCRRALTKRGFNHLNWIKPSADFSTEDGIPAMTQERFLELWHASAEDTFARYNELVPPGRRKPRIGDKRFDEHQNGKPYWDEVERIDTLQEQGLLTQEQVDEIWNELHPRLVWIRYRMAAEKEPGGSAIPDTYLEAEHGFVLGQVPTRDSVLAQEWAMAREGDTFTTDFRTWLEKVHV